MKVFISKCNSFLQRDQSFDFHDEECDLSEEILSEGTTAKSTSFENNMQFNMEKVNFKSKKVVRSGKCNQQNTNAKEKINLELSHAVERSDALLEVRNVPNSPCFSAYKLEESKSNKSRSIINASIPTRTTLKDEIRQLLRCLAQERNNSSVKVDSKHHDEALKLDNKNLCHLEVNKCIPVSPQKSFLNKPSYQRNIAGINNNDHPEEITMSNVLPSCDLNEIFC